MPADRPGPATPRPLDGDPRAHDGEDDPVMRRFVALAKRSIIADAGLETWRTSRNARLDEILVWVAESLHAESRRGHSDGATLSALRDAAGALARIAALADEATAVLDCGEVEQHPGFPEVARISDEAEGALASVNRALDGDDGVARPRSLLASGHGDDDGFDLAGALDNAGARCVSCGDLLSRRPRDGLDCARCRPVRRFLDERVRRSKVAEVTRPIALSDGARMSDGADPRCQRCGRDRREVDGSDFDPAHRLCVGCDGGTGTAREPAGG